MRGFMNSLALQALLTLLVVCSSNGAPYSKYGRTCKDIGCLPREVCVMAYESCSFNQQENVSCGRYPTCKKNTDAQSPPQNTDPTRPPAYNPSYNPTQPSTSIWNFPQTTKYTTQRTTTTTTTTRRPWTTKTPFYNPSNPSYNGAGSYYGNRYGDDDTYFGGSPFNRPTTAPKRPSSSSDGFFSGFSDILKGELGKFIGSALSGGGNRGSGGSSFGSLFGGDTRPLSENRNYRGGLFSENTGTSGSSSNSNHNAYPVTRYGEASPSSSQPASSAPSHGTYGWKLS